MKSRIISLVLTTLAATALSACGTPRTALPAMPGVQRMQAATARTASGQLNYAREMRGFSSIQNPMRTMMAEFVTADGKKFDFHADRFLNHPEFNIALRDTALDFNHPGSYFSSKDKGRVQALVDTLQKLDTSAVKAEEKASLGRIIDHLKSAL